MFGIIKRHSVKILVFTINIFLAAIAVFIIREKDQARLLEKAQMNNYGSENAADNTLPSFKSSVGAEESNVPADIPDQSSPVSSEAAVPTEPVPVPQNIVPTPVPTPVIPAPPSVPQTKPSNAQTKTS